MHGDAEHWSLGGKPAKATGEHTDALVLNANKTTVVIGNGPLLLLVGACQDKCIVSVTLPHHFLATFMNCMCRNAEMFLISFQAVGRPRICPRSYREQSLHDVTFTNVLQCKSAV